MLKAKSVIFRDNKILVIVEQNIFVTCYEQFTWNIKFLIRADIQVMCL